MQSVVCKCNLIVIQFVANANNEQPSGGWRTVALPLIPTWVIGIRSD